MADTIDTTGQAPYEQCGYCHEYDGNSLMTSYPNLAQQKPRYIIKQLEDFRAGKRKGPMQATAELLSDDDIIVVANYFSQQKLKRVAEPLLSKQQRDIAKRLLDTGDANRGIPACSRCHGENAQGVGVFPRLAGQHADYLVTQLSAFKQRTRVNDEQDKMQKLSQHLSESEIVGLAAYLSGISVTAVPVSARKSNINQ